MTHFRTNIKVQAQNKSITYNDKIMMLGSCFSENMGQKLQAYKFNTLINPLGILYNPESIATSLELIVDKKKFTTNDLFEHEGLWHSFAHHSRFSDTNKEVVLESINQQIVQAHEHLKQSTFLILTFGTSWVFEHLENGNIVANCHKLPSKTFKRYRLSLSAILDRYQHLIEKLRVINPTLNVIFTVSPIRHLKDGFEENQLSKATLLLATHQIIKMIKDSSYFPSYEIMMDDLRDYRFYAEDMVHPSPLAIDYIWEQFCNAWINPKSQQHFSTVEKIMRAIQHRPFNLETMAHQKFIKKQIELISILENENKMMEFSEEKKVFMAQLV